jgi:hypothetical protein
MLEFYHRPDLVWSEPEIADAIWNCGGSTPENRLPLRLGMRFKRHFPDDRQATVFYPVCSFFGDRCAIRPDVVDLLIHVHLAAFFFAVFFLQTKKKKGSGQRRRGSSPSRRVRPSVTVGVIFVPGNKLGLTSRLQGK